MRYANSTSGLARNYPQPWSINTNQLSVDVENAKKAEKGMDFTGMRIFHTTTRPTAFILEKKDEK